MQNLHVLKPKKYTSGDKLNKAHELRKLCISAHSSSCVLLGDSFISRLEWRHKLLANSYFKDWLNLGIGGDKVENLLWRVKNGDFPRKSKKVFMSIGTNNIFKNDALSIANTIIEISEIIKATGSEVYICAQYPRVNREMSNEIVKLNSLLKSKCAKNRLRFIENENIFWKNGSINAKLYLDDKINLTSYGYKLF